MARPRTKRTPARTPKARTESARPIAKAQAASDSAAQPVEKKNMKEVKKLIDLGKEKGYLTYDDVNDMLPAEVVSPDQIDDVMSIFGEMDIEVVDANQRVTLGGTGEDLAEEEEEEKEIELDSDGDVVGKTGDPVRMTTTLSDDPAFKYFSGKTAGIMNDLMSNSLLISESPIKK